jgi:regulator of ribonuclease activity A
VVVLLTKDRPAVETQGEASTISGVSQDPKKIVEVRFSEIVDAPWMMSWVSGLSPLVTRSASTVQVPPRSLARTLGHKRISAQRRSMSSPPPTHPPTFKSTPDICDDFEDTIRVVDPTLGFQNFGGKTRFGGQAVTVKCFEDNSMVKHLAKSMDGTNKVMVVDGGGSRRRALLGDQVAADCVEQGWEGLVLFGSIRDVDEIGALNLGVQALGSHPCKTVKRNEGQINVPVSFGGVEIREGDWIVCDNNGIVVTDADPRKK